ncbi:IclR family transcriptional regulator [Roseomonas sp. JC162]|uniref:IclR family transcriptional regulator n=1 Tax=Neoroseomonas marina TaxID=1232220 RepID=A0A848EAL9_9PROT|nr:IclR family transcriptional regulator [Neoroseomonas marina]NMJ41544.1 IclR family transcriptional regulator [Neoroseomonas marina]
MAIKATRASVRRAGERRAAVKAKVRAPAPEAAQEDEDATGDERPIAAVERALSVLSAFRAAPRLSLSELSKLTGLFKSTLLRILATLERNGYVMRLADGQYRVGGILFELGSGYVASFHIEEVMKPALAQLVAATGETAAFYVRAGTQRQCVFRVDSPQAVRHVITAGQILELDSAATSQILRRYEKGGRRPTAETDYTALCRSTSGQGDVDTASVAAPIFDTGGFIGVINISGPVHRFTKPVAARCLTELAATAARLSRALGGIGPDNAGGPPS